MVQPFMVAPVLLWISTSAVKPSPQSLLVLYLTRQSPLPVVVGVAVGATREVAVAVGAAVVAVAVGATTVAVGVAAGVPPVRQKASTLAQSTLLALMATRTLVVPAGAALKASV